MIIQGMHTHPNAPGNVFYDIHRHQRYLGLAISPVSEEANDVHEALNKARQMYETGLVNVSIADQAGRKIDRDELLACITGKKTITNDLQAK